jgi:hypothetical protein
MMPEQYRPGSPTEGGSFAVFGMIFGPKLHHFSLRQESP